jgi:putative endopeptidase
MAVADLDKEMPEFAWKNTLNTIGVHSDSVNVSQPEYYIKLNKLLKSVPLDIWKAYLKFHLLDDAANSLSSDFVNARFEFVKALNGQQKLKPRWQRVVVNTDNNLGDALGELYVEKYFTEEAKTRMLEMVNNLQAAFANRIDKLDWMSDSTKTIAKDKLNAFLKKIGYTDKWRDYSKVTIDRGKYFENLVSSAKNEYQYQINKVGKKVDKTEWQMTPPTINAYYNPTFNEIVFPAGILQFPFFDPNSDDAINYGGIGMAIGHEMTHGFDDQGAQYDKEGNLKNWWAKSDSMKFVAKTKQVIDLYNTYIVIDSVHVNGALTTGENIADIGGVAIAYDAFKMTKQGQDTTRIDGFTPDQRFFISLGQIWREKLKPETVRFYANVDPHSPSMFRVNGPLSNFTPFYTAFNVQPGDKMYLPEDKRIKIW